MHKLVLLLLVLLPVHALAGDWRAVDGDTIDTGDERVRLLNIDAPESKQPHGAEATAFLQEMLAGAELRLDGNKRDRYGRRLALVYADGVQVNRELVRSGNAWVYDRYNEDPMLIPVEVEARKAKVGLWATPDPIAPWEWRKMKRK